VPPEFVFMTSVQSVQLTGLRASNLAQLAAGIAEVDGSSIYHHTYRFYRAHAFLGNTPISDFAYWVGGILREDAAAERMASLDLRDFRSIRALRNALLAALEPVRNDATRWSRSVPPGLEFHFARSVSLVLPTGWRAGNLEGFEEALERVDTGSLYYHLIEAPLHLESESPVRNDFSIWLEEVVGRHDLAGAVDSLDPYRGDLEALRGDLLGILRPAGLRQKLRNVLARVEHRPGPVTEWIHRSRKGG